MHRGKKYQSNQENEMTGVFEEEELDCLDNGDNGQKIEISINKTYPFNEMKSCSDEESCEENKEKLTDDKATFEDNGNKKKNKELNTVDFCESNCQQNNKKFLLPKTILPEPSYRFFNDISVFCFSQQGESHIKNNIPCQDRSGFRLLMNNADPFATISFDNQLSASVNDVYSPIFNGECAFVKDIPGKKIPDWAPDFDALPIYIKDLFKRVFDYNCSDYLKKIVQRPTAEEWMQALLQYYQTPLKHCRKDTFHWYRSELSKCPFCEKENVEKESSFISIGI